MQLQSITSPLETWKSIPAYEGLYEVSNLGRVRHGSHVLSSYVNNWGYVAVRLCWSGRVTTWPVQRLVLAAFYRLPTNLEQANHINGIKTDNRPVNLEWVTASGNVRHAYATGLQGSSAHDHRGERNPRAKLTAVDVLAIRAARGQTTQEELAHRYDVAPSRIGDIQLHKSWQHI